MHEKLQELYARLGNFLKVLRENNEKPLLYYCEENSMQRTNNVSKTNSTQAPEA